RNEPKGREQGTFRSRDQNYQGREQGYQDRDHPYQERDRETQKYNPYTKQNFSFTNNPLKWNRTHQYDNRDRGEGWDDDPNDEWTNRTQMQKDATENHKDRDSTKTEDEASQHQVTASQPEQLVQPTQRIQQVQVQPKQQTTVQNLRQRG
ncbi:MAG: hypothetical protein EZS28_045626, partial [Streblomastix strix]